MKDLTQDELKTIKKTLAEAYNLLADLFVDANFTEYEKGKQISLLEKIVDSFTLLNRVCR